MRSKTKGPQGQAEFLRNARSAGVDCSKLERDLGTSLGPLLDALSLGLDDQETARLTNLKEDQVRHLRTQLGCVGSSLGLDLKKPVCHDQKDIGKKRAE